MRTITVSVTAEDIASGKRYDCEACPIALAVRRVIGPLDIFVCREIGRESIGIHPVPALPEAKAFMDAFDNGEAVAPFSFQLEVDDSWPSVSFPTSQEKPDRV